MSCFSFKYDQNGCDESRPLIYVWYIGEHRYVGKSKRGADRPRKHYRLNVERYLAGLSYRKGKPDGWRRVHCAMFEAVEKGWPMTLRLVTNVEGDIFAAEREWQQKLNADLNDKLGTTEGTTRSYRECPTRAEKPEITMRRVHLVDNPPTHLPQSQRRKVQDLAREFDGKPVEEFMDALGKLLKRMESKSSVTYHMDLLLGVIRKRSGAKRPPTIRIEP